MHIGFTWQLKIVDKFDVCLAEEQHVASNR